MILITANQLVGAYEGQRIQLECNSEAYPKSINYFTREGDIIPKGEIHNNICSATRQITDSIKVLRFNAHNYFQNLTLFVTIHVCVCVQEAIIIIYSMNNFDEFLSEENCY